jgi:hypothetical protein
MLKVLAALEPEVRRCRRYPSPIVSTTWLNEPAGVADPFFEIVAALIDKGKTKAL